MLFKRFTQLAVASRRLMSSESGAVGSDSGESAIRRWKLLTCFVALPAVIVCYLNAFYVNPDDHGARPDFVPYEHLRRRTKPFPWGDGNHSLLHNSHVNALPDGYEDGEH